MEEFRSSQSRWKSKIFRKESGSKDAKDPKATADLVDFLRPSTDRTTAPKPALTRKPIDTAAQREPDAVDGPPIRQYQGWQRPTKKRKGLTVGFVMAVPEIIGEGGDEADTPPMEISRLKTRSLDLVRRPVPSARVRSGTMPENVARLQPPRMSPTRQYRPDMQRASTHDQGASTRPVPSVNLPRRAPSDHAQAPPGSNESSPRRHPFVRAPTGMPSYETDEGSMDGHRQRPLTLSHQPEMRGASFTPLSRLSPSRLPDHQIAQSGLGREAAGQSQPGTSPKFFDSEYFRPYNTSVLGQGSPSPRRKQMHREEGLAFRRSIVEGNGFPSPVSSDTRQSSSGSEHQGQKRDSTRPSSAGLERTSNDALETYPISPPSPISKQSPQAFVSGPYSVSPPSPEFLHSASSGRDSVSPPSPQPQYSLRTAGTPTRPNTFRRAAREISPSPKPRKHTTNQPADLVVKRQRPQEGFNDKKQTQVRQNLSNTAATGLPAVLRIGPEAVPDPDPPEPNRERAPASWSSIQPQILSRGSLDAPAAPSPQPSLGSSSYFGLARPEEGPSPPTYRDPPSPSPSKISNRTADTQVASLTDTEAIWGGFPDRVSHLRQIFKLTADFERPKADHTAVNWLRAALWWFLKGRAGLEATIRGRPKTPEGRRSRGPVEGEKMSQPHVDLAKTWWIVTEVLELLPEWDRNAHDTTSCNVRMGVQTLQAHVRPLILSMARHNLLPPPQALVQGLDTSVWIKYPTFAPDVASVLSGAATKSLVVDVATPTLDPVSAMPLGETATEFSYGRMFVDVSVATEDTNDETTKLPCVLSILRAKTEMHLKVVISSQSGTVSTLIKANNKIGPTWEEVRWLPDADAINVRLPRGLTLYVEMEEKDFNTLRSMFDHTAKTEARSRARPDEVLLLETVLKDFHYIDSASPPVFPPHRIPRCQLRIFERIAAVRHQEGRSERKFHNGYRIHIATGPQTKQLSSVSHVIGKQHPLDFDLVRDPQSGDSAAMYLRLKDQGRECRMTCVFQRLDECHKVYSTLNGMVEESGESTCAKVHLRCLNIEKVRRNSIEKVQRSEDAFTSALDPLKGLRWQEIRVINLQADEPENMPETVLSERLRIVMRHEAGSITDRINVGPGELQFRLDVGNGAQLTMLRGPQDDLSSSINCRKAGKDFPHQRFLDLLQTIATSPTIRTLTLDSTEDMHLFQHAITGFRVRYDGIASQMMISRRRMVVPIYKQWTASQTRIQIVHQPSSKTTQLLAFFTEDFVHGDALNFQLKSLDVFEKVEAGGSATTVFDKLDKKKAGGAGADAKGWGIRFVDAKFPLPVKPADGRRGMVNLEPPESPEFEHDDITVWFEAEDERDRFASALPAAPQTARGATFKRRI